jgi:hypothetical protein
MSVAGVGGDGKIEASQGKCKTQSEKKLTKEKKMSGRHGSNGRAPA